MGYVAWYAALRGLTATHAAVVQLSVPIIAAVGGIVFLTEALSTRLVVAALLVLGGVALAILGRQRRSAGGYWNWNRGHFLAWLVISIGLILRWGNIIRTFRTTADEPLTRTTIA